MSEELRLYRVAIDGLAYALATSGREAERLVEEALECADLPVACHAILNRATPPDGAWSDCLPFGEDDEEWTVAEIIAAYVPDQQDMERAGQLRLEGAS